MELLFRDRSERGKLRLTGPQRAWFLHQILTQAFEDIAPGEARDAAKLTVHGRMTAFVEVLATEDALLCHFEPELRSTLPDEIRKYVFATRVEIEDVGDDSALVLVAGRGWLDAVRAAGVGRVHPTTALGVPAGYVWLPPEDKDTLIEHLNALGAEEVSESRLEDIRVENAVPRWGFDMDTKTFPQEAGIDSWAVHYDKGCYVGQEAMAKIHFRGKVNRRLVKLIGSGFHRNDDVTVDGERVGTVTSVAEQGALALVKRTVEPGTEAMVGSVPVKVAT